MKISIGFIDICNDILSFILNCYTYFYVLHIFYYLQLEVSECGTRVSNCIHTNLVRQENLICQNDLSFNRFVNYQLIHLA
jgi:hypothetical protein